MKKKESYSTRRLQCDDPIYIACITINGPHSSPANVISGVPQGSVLGPVLCILYINDIINTIHSNIRLFVDDSIIYREIRSPADHDILQTYIQKLTDWSNKWQNKFNASKYQNA